MARGKLSIEDKLRIQTLGMKWLEVNVITAGYHDRLELEHVAETFKLLNGKVLQSLIRFWWIFTARLYDDFKK